MSINKNPKIDMKCKYMKHCEIGTICSLVLIIIFFLYFPHITKSAIDISETQELVEMEDVSITKQEAEPPAPPKPIIPIETPAEEIQDDILLEETDLDVTEIINTPPPEMKIEEEEEVQPTFFVAVEEMPEPIGGIAGIQSKIIYPEIAKRAGVQGKVYLKAFVNEKGIVQRVEILKGIGAGCDEAAVQAVMDTRFNPGKQRGRPVKVQVSIPIKFVLTDNV